MSASIDSITSASIIGIANMGTAVYFFLWCFS